MSVLIDAFPSERPRLEEFIETAGLSRIYAGLHYRFDIEAGEPSAGGRRRSRWRVRWSDRPAFVAARHTLGINGRVFREVRK